jgi:hypothetical protein
MAEPTVFKSDESPNLRIVHAANYQFAKDGLVFFNPDLKLHQGLVQAGHYVFPFSINDRSRMLSLTGSKTFGKGKCNQALIKTCANVNPDMLLLGHAQYITRETLETIREQNPNIRIGLWYFDALWNPKNIEHIYERNEILDAVFATTGGQLLESLSRSDCPAGFIPNPVEPSIERLRAFENPTPKYDLVFFGSDKRAPERKVFLKELVKLLPDARLGIFGSLGNSFVFGHEKEQILADSRMALNLNRRNDVELYSSDRIAQLTGNGLLTLTPSGAGLEQLYSQDEVAYFDSVQHLAEVVKRFIQDDARAVEITKNGWRRTHQEYSAKQVAEFIVALTNRDESYREASWSQHVYWGDQQRQLRSA